MGADDPSRDRTAPGRTATTPLDPVIVARATDDAFKRLVHEIAGLVDGSLRYLRLVQRDLATHDNGTPAPTSIAYLDSATDALARVASLVHDARGSITRYSSINVGRHLSAGRSLREIIEHAAAVIRPLAEEHGIVLEADVDPTIDEVPPLPLYPVIVNALKNGVEACVTGDRVALRAWTEEEGAGTRTVHVEIIDSGAGLPSDHSRLFEAGFTTKEEGVGIGLAIARDIVRELDGDIEITPNEGARGARLTVRVPVTERRDES